MYTLSNRQNIEQERKRGKGERERMKVESKQKQEKQMKRKEKDKQWRMECYEYAKFTACGLWHRMHTSH